MKLSRKMTALFLALALMLTVTAALANTLEPEKPEADKLAGGTFRATIQNYNADKKLFEVELYAKDIFAKDAVEKLQAGDAVILGGAWTKVASLEKDADGNNLLKTEDGGEYVFSQDGDSADKLYAMLTEGDAISYHMVGKLCLPMAEDCALEDASDLEASEAKVTTGLENILKEKEALEKDSIGLEYRNTTIVLNDNLEIAHINREFNPAQ